jgi:hypothetical protein
VRRSQRGWRVVESWTSVASSFAQPSRSLLIADASKMLMGCTSSCTPPGRSTTPDACCSSTGRTALRCKSQVRTNEEPPFCAWRPLASRVRGVPDVRSDFRGLQQLWRYAQHRHHYATRGTGIKRAAPHPSANCADRRARVDPADIAPVAMTATTQPAAASTTNAIANPTTSRAVASSAAAPPVPAGATPDRPFGART